jgi:hypothetical protein
MSWANAIDEESNSYDQMMANVLVAAHYYDGDQKWLSRAYQMACGYGQPASTTTNSTSARGAPSGRARKFLMEMLYQPLLGDVEWGTRGNIPQLVLRHKTGGAYGLPKGMAFRCHMLKKNEYAFEAVNTGSEAASWEIEAASGIAAVSAPGSSGNRIALAPGQRASGTITIRSKD